MNWSRIKVFFILWLLAVNLFLGLRLYQRYRSEYTVSRRERESLAYCLSQNGVTVGADTIPSRMQQQRVYAFRLSEETWKERFEAMLGAAASGSYLLPAVNGISFSFDDDSTVFCYQNLNITYTNGAVSYGEETARFRENPSAYARITGIRAQKTEKNGKAMLTRLTEADSFDGMRLYPVLRGAYKTQYDGISLLVFDEVFSVSGRGETELDGCTVYMLATEERVLYFDGKWLPSAPVDAYQPDLMGQLDALYGARELLSGTVVTDMEQVGYLLWDNTGDIYLHPAWRYTGEDAAGNGYICICDAETGNLLSDTQKKE